MNKVNLELQSEAALRAAINLVEAFERLPCELGICVVTQGGVSPHLTKGHEIHAYTRGWLDLEVFLIDYITYIEEFHGVRRFEPEADLDYEASEFDWLREM